MKLKICGMRYPENIAEIAALRPNYLGFIFYGKSPRYAGDLAPEIVQTLPSDILKVGVFVNAPEKIIAETVAKYQLDLIQLHGNESPETCLALRKIRLVIKAVSVAAANDVAHAAAIYQNAVDYFLFDTKTPLFGGSGAQFDWSALTAYTGNTPFFLSGGIGADDAEHLKTLHHPQLHAIDVNSRFETTPGRKEATELREFMRKIQKI
ncbi:MAG: phosphoribosylanthranilate isomerase [Bacteroidales bacterium]|jgi:phosphoribosylanthranilate isomerase|nr:phosphoribosylanthranilate isomerase [Bacteroidales bacterium]